ncbi:hypothetical protein PBCVCZ2_194R, partial [Paramecium bursaria Chlorella virus CZ-2]
MKVGEVIIVE